MPVAFTIGDRPFGFSVQEPSVAPFSLIHASGSTPRAVVEDCLSQIQSVPADVSFGMVYATEEMGGAFEEALEFLQLELPEVSWVGATVPAVFAGRAQYQGLPAMAIVLGRLGADSFRIMSTTRRNMSGQLDRLNEWRQRNGNCDAIVHADANNKMLGQIVGDLSRGLGTGSVSGGLTSSRRDSLQVAVSMTSGGLSGVLLGRGISVLNGCATAASVLGLPHVITASRGNEVLELDHEPALDVLYREAGELLARNPQRLSRFIFPACGPYVGDGSAYLQRRFVGFDLESRSFHLDDLSATLNNLRFYRSDPEVAEHSFEQMLSGLHRRLAGRKVRAAILVSGVPCQPGIEEAGRELAQIRSVFGELPLLGYRSCGELYNGARQGNSSVLSLVV